MRDVPLALRPASAAGAPARSPAHVRVGPCAHACGMLSRVGGGGGMVVVVGAGVGVDVWGVAARVARFWCWAHVGV